MELMLLTSFGEIMAYVGYVLLAILVLLVMITVHELGHYIAGKIFGFAIEEFAIGFGPKIFSKKKKDGEVFSIRLFPIGGFCAFRGEDKDSQDPNAFNNKKPWKRIIVLVAGAMMNYITALLIIVLMFSIWGQPALMTYKVAENPAYTIENSFCERDVIVKANGKNVYLVTDLMTSIKGVEQGEKVKFTVLRNGELVDVEITMRTDTHFKSIDDMVKLYDALGVSYSLDQNGQITNGGMYSTSLYPDFFTLIGRTFEYSFKLAGTIFTVIGQLITGALGLKSVGGTVTTIAVTAGAIKTGGMRYLMLISSLIGVNLAVFNLLPIPALDGSRVVFTGLEWIRRKPINRKVEGIIHMVGLVALLLFAVIVDLQQCF